MVEQLFNTHRKFDKLYPESQYKQRLKMCMMKISSSDKHATVGKEILTLTRKNKKCNKNLQIQQYSPDDNSPVKPALSAEFTNNCDESDSNIDGNEGINSNVCKVFQDINEENMIDNSNKPELMKKVGVYEHNIEISLTRKFMQCE